MQRVNVGHKHLADYASIVGRSLADEIRALAEPLRGRRMLHLSATAFGGSAAAIAAATPTATTKATAETMRSSMPPLCARGTTVAGPASPENRP